MRLTHCRGQSLQDWIALRYGRISAFPDGVAFPGSEQDIRNLITYARNVGTHVIPYGGGTSVVGHINPVKSDAPATAGSLWNFVCRAVRLRFFLRSRTCPGDALSLG
jgi:alkyldihydroxyacetonephosphate synthase